MSLEPNYLVLIAPGADANDQSPAWVDVSDDLISVAFARGSPSDLDRNNPGAGTVVLDNYSGAYDNENSGSPYAGDLVPMLQIRILAEWDGDLYPQVHGYADDVALDYPGKGQATATVTFTDGFKPQARTFLPTSPYAAEVVLADPTIFWRLTGSVDLGAYDTEGPWRLDAVGSPTFDVESLAINDPDTAVSFAAATAGLQGIFPEGSWPFTTAATAEMLWRYDDSGIAPPLTIALVAATLGATAYGFQITLSTSDGNFDVVAVNNAGTTFAVSTTGFDYRDNATHHVALVIEAGVAIRIEIDGVDRAASAVVFTGTMADTIDKWIVLTNACDYAPFSFTGTLTTVDDLALYATALAAATTDSHYDAAITGWRGDTPGERAGRILDVMAWPAGMRDLDAGSSTLQSAELDMAALEHLQKTAESEFGEWFVSADGTATLRGRTARINRDPIATFGDAAGEINYREIRFDNSDELIRNPVTISRLNGISQTALDATNTARYYPSQYTLDGLYHDPDSLSRDAANFYLSEYKDPRRRIVGLEFGPARDDARFDLYPLLLEVELGQVYTVVYRPPNADTFTQNVIVEGLRAQWTPAVGHSISLDLSPAFAGAFLQLDNAEVTIEGANPGRLFF